jgi:membrane protease YdiL (CAAX protease family)
MSLTTDPQPPDPPWGVAASIAWTLTALVIGIVVAAVFLGILSGGGSQRSSNAYDGVMIAFGIFASVPAQVAVLVFAAQWRRWPPAIYLVEAWRTAVDAGWLVGLLAAVVVVAPIGEEIIFRGFLFRGLAKPGWEVHAVGGIALAWALLHIQYDWFGMAQIFLAGLMLGWFRWASGSTILTIGMHMLINLLSMIETWIKVEYFS